MTLMHQLASGLVPSKYAPTANVIILEIGKHKNIKSSDLGDLKKTFQLVKNLSEWGQL